MLKKSAEKNIGATIVHDDVLTHDEIDRLVSVPRFIKEDATTIYFPLTIEAESSEKILYTYKKEWD